MPLQRGQQNLIFSISDYLIHRYLLFSAPGQGNIVIQEEK